MSEYVLPEQLQKTTYTQKQLQYPMTKNLKISPTLMGLEPTLVPFCDHISSQRMNMCTSNLPQTLIIDGAEFPQVASGYEHEFLKYRFDATRFDQDAVILAVIPRYRVGVGAHPITCCPSYTVIYYGEEDEQIHSMFVNTYEQGTNGFGYDLLVDTSKLFSETRIPKGTSLSHARTVQGERYCSGINANICYITAKETVEDAFAISESLAKKMTTTGIKSITIDIPKNLVPLNLYGDRDVYKFLPDIGEQVRPNGVVCAFRKADSVTYISDFSNTALREIRHITDKVFYASHAEATVINIEVFKNDSRKVKTPAYVFEQLDTYIDEDTEYRKRILDLYETECLKKKKVAGNEFKNLVTDCARKMFSTPGVRVFNKSRKTPIKYAQKNDAIEFIRIVVTLRYKQHVSLGAKITGLSGDLTF